MRDKNRGFTLIEFLVSIVILSVAMLGLLEAVNSAMYHNMSTQLRDTAVRLADERMAEEKSKSFAAITSNTSDSRYISASVANAFKNYSVVKSVSEITSNTKSVQVEVSWEYKGKRIRHVISSLASDH